jgi:tetratricopeptide (TPR) repeat protein
VNPTKNAGRWAVVALGALVFLAPLKFSTPVVMQSMLPAPRGLWEWVLSPWPNPLLVILAFAGLIWFAVSGPGLSTSPGMVRDRLVAGGAGHSRRRFDALRWLPLVWLLTQVAATPRSINAQTSVDTLLHFAVCVVVFYAAARWVRDEKAARWVFGALAAATALVCLAALQQRFGGFAATREYATAYLDPATISNDLRSKLMSNRVYGTFVYPNALAGFLVVAFAPVMAWLWEKAGRRTTKTAVLALASGVMVFCLVLTGSRGGFTALAAVVVAGTLCLVRGRTAMRTVGVGMLVLVALVLVFSAAELGGLIHLGRQSLAARLDYWNGAARIVRDYPWFGTGPGTFGSIYTKYKTAATEEAQLVHNSYLQMWCDSGVAAFAAFLALWAVALGDAFRLVRRRRDVVSVAVCAALVGWTVHGLVDFDLYAPGVAVPAFVMLGILQGLKSEEGTENSGGRKAWTMFAAGMVVALAVVWFEARMLAANLAYGESRDCGKDWPTAVAAAEHAAALAPRNAVYQMTAGELLVSAKRFAAGLEYCRRAVENDPLRASYHYRLAQAFSTAGRPTNEVSQELRRSAELNPTREQYWEGLPHIEENR